MKFSQAEGNIKSVLVKLCLHEYFFPKRKRIENGKGDISSLQLISLHKELLQEMRIFI